MKTLMVCLMILMGNVAQAQDVKDILSGVLGGSSTDGVVSNLTTVFSKSKQATQDKIIGTWSYTESAIVFTSDNILAKVGSKIAANKLENKLQEYLTRYGIKYRSFRNDFQRGWHFHRDPEWQDIKGKVDCQRL